MEIKKPNFLIVGAAKAGTTSLAKYLNEHPDIFIPEKKELRYFVKDHLKEVTAEDPLIQDILKNSTLNKDEYYAQFQVEESMRGEASVHYLFEYEEAIPKIKNELGDIPIIIILRNPVDRIISHIKYLNHHYEYSGNKELELEEIRIKNKYNSFWYYQSLSYYSHQVKAYLDNFSDVKVFLFEDLKTNPQTILSNIFQFFNIQDKKYESFEVYNQSIVLKDKYKHFKKISWIIPNGLKIMIKKRYSENLYNEKLVNIDENLIEKLKKLYENEIIELENIIQVDLKKWRL